MSEDHRAADGPPVESAGQVDLIVNGKAKSVQAASSLLSVLRDELGLTGAKPGCGEGSCGSCTVLVDGEPTRSCQRTAADVDGRSITTVEGLSADGRLHHVQQAFVDVGAAQCGYCTPAMVLGVAALLSSDPSPDVSATDEALAGILCRCGCYPRIRRAVHRAAELVASGEAGTEKTTTAGAGRWGPPEPGSPGPRPLRPWDLTEPLDRDWFGVLGDGLVVVLPPAPLAPGAWSTDGGAWLHVADDATVTAFTGKVDVGQDNCTALRLLVAEELEVPLGNVRLAMGDTDLCPYDMGTFGSRSMPDAGSALRRVAAHARTFQPVLAGSKRVEVVAGDAPLSSPADWRVAGTPHVPEGTLDIVTGRRRYVSDLTVAGLRHGAVLRPPAVGATLQHLDASAVEDRADVIFVRTRGLIGVVGDDPAAARSAVNDLRAQWVTPDLPSEADLEPFLRSHPSTETGGWSRPFHSVEGNPDEGFEVAQVVEEATYTTAYIASAALETRAALAVWDDDGRLTLWVGTQTPFMVRAQVAAALDLDEEQVRVIVPPTGGGFGGKHGADVATEAAVLAREAGAPVRVAWTRHEEFTAGTLRPAAVIDVAAGATSRGEITAWTFTNINSGPAAINSPYRVPNERIEYQSASSPLLQGSYRALAATANNFARESHIDGLARELGHDPLEFRLDNLADERLAAVLRAAAEHFGWATAGGGKGLACGLEKDGRVATVAEVRGSGGDLEVVRLVTAYECGAVVNPETVINQIEGATVMALGGALFEAIHFTDGVITNGAFSAYRVPRFHDVPPIEVVLIDRPDLPSAGAGETPMIAVAPAIANAIFDATRRRLRSLPLLSDGASRLDP